jgi:hypothetical protein
MATGWTTGVRFPGDAVIFLSGQALAATQSPMEWIPGTVPLELKRPEHEGNHYIPLYVVMQWCLIKR